MPESDTICGYALTDVRKTLRDAIDFRERRKAHRWTAELVVTPGAVGSLWSAYWMAWSVAQGAGSASPTLPILLKQSWTDIAAKAHDYAGDWSAFRNDPAVRAIAADTTERLLIQSRQTPVVWPSREVILYDVGTMREQQPPPAVDSSVVLAVWQRNEDSMELRMMAGRWLTFLIAGDLRSALSCVAWSMLPTAQQSLPQPLKVADRGPPTLPPKARTSPLWFWLDIGRAYLKSTPDLHRGWITMHAAITDAFRSNYKRWTAADRMRVLLAWILQIRASMTPHPNDLWTALPIDLTAAEVDLPYKEVAAELANPLTAIQKPQKKEKEGEEEGKKAVAERAMTKMATADAAIYAAMGLTEEDV